MARAFITAWRRDTWREAEASGSTGRPLDHTASDQLESRGIGPGDRLYVLGNDDGRLIVIGRMTVHKLLDRPSADARYGPDVWDAQWHAVARESTSQRFDRVVPEEDARAITGASGRALRIAPGEYRLDSQTLMTVREITAESAEILDRVLERGDEPTQLATTELARRLGPAERKAVEERAMELAREELSRRGWTSIERTAERSAWDYEVAPRGGGEGGSQGQHGSASEDATHAQRGRQREDPPAVNLGNRRGHRARSRHRGGARRAAARARPVASGRRGPPGGGLQLRTAVVDVGSPNGPGSAGIPEQIEGACGASRAGKLDGRSHRQHEQIGCGLRHGGRGNRALVDERATAARAAVAPPAAALAARQLRRKLESSGGACSPMTHPMAIDRIVHAAAPPVPGRAVRLAATS